jgi:hypothetical protein
MHKKRPMFGSEILIKKPIKIQTLKFRHECGIDH